MTSGRSVAISSLAVGQASARASTAPKTATADSQHIWRVRLGTGWLWLKLLLLGQKRRALGYNNENNPYCQNSARSVEKMRRERKSRPALRECAMK